MKTLVLDGIKYRIKREKTTLYVCQMIDAQGRDINARGEIVSEIPQMMKFRRGYGTRIISKSRIKKVNKQLTLF